LCAAFFLWLINTLFVLYKFKGFQGNFFGLQKTLSCYELDFESISQIANDSVKNQKREDEKLNILKEIVASEKKYLNDIHAIVEVRWLRKLIFFII
jgi:hypothetical protein